jgi:ABC-type amino acid transport system permease subunit
LIATAASLFAFNILTTGLDRRAIQHGQVCFVVAASVWLGCFLAHRMVAVRSVLWSILSVSLLAVVGYLWAGARSPDPNLPPSVPTSHFLRVLPIQFIAVGAAAAIAAYWSMLRHRAIHSVDDETIEAARPSGVRR